MLRGRMVTNGACYGAGTKLGFSDTPIFAEANGFLLAAKIASWPTFKNIIIEGDCQVVIKILKGEHISSPWRIWKTLDDIRGLQSYFDNCTFNFVTKSANSAAHCLAAHALSNYIQNRWTADQIPASIATLWDVATI